jgi:hypothetical protein
VTVNEVDYTFVGRAAGMSVDQAISILANIYLLRSGDARISALSEIRFSIYERFGTWLT